MTIPYDIDLEKLTPEQRKKLKDIQDEVISIIGDIPFIKIKPAPYGLDVAFPKQE